MVFEKLVKDNQAFIFELDDVLYPKKDYLLQVYYLFAQFMEYTEQLNATEILSFMQAFYSKEGEAELFLKTTEHFNLPLKYQYNFELLHENARLPLKLLLFAPVLDFMKHILGEGKRIFLLADGNPTQQLNKIKQVEWNGLETHLVAYFTEEISKNGRAAAIETIADKHAIRLDQTVIIMQQEHENKMSLPMGINLLTVDKLLSL
jgi:FMN phosphatase YigB (HAD superfamily)